MNTYSLSLFVHIVGALVLFSALVLEWVGLRQIRNAILSDQVRTWMGILNGASKAGFPSMLVTVVTGIYMMVAWGRTPWLVTTVGALILMIALTRVAAPRLKSLGQSLNPVSDLLLWVSIQTRAAIALGIVFLKIAKPDWLGSLLTLGTAVVFGIVSALLTSRHAQTQMASTD